MSEENNDQVDYKAEYEKLTKQVESANAESKRRKVELGELRTEMEGLKAHKTEVETLRSELRMVKHKDGMKALYDDADLNLNSKVSIDRLMKIMDYRAEQDEFDIKSVKEKVLSLKETDPYLFVEKQSGEEPVTPQSPAPKWANRGASDAKTVRNTPLTEAQMRDPSYMAAYFKSQSKK